MEAEIISSVIDLYKGDKKNGACGLCTSGGTESIMMSLLAHREFYKNKKGITQPNLIMS